MYGYINCSLIFHIQNLDGLHDDFHTCTRTSVPALRMVTAAVIRNPDANNDAVDENKNRARNEGADRDTLEGDALCFAEIVDEYQ